MSQGIFCIFCNPFFLFPSAFLGQSRFKSQLSECNMVLLDCYCAVAWGSPNCNIFDGSSGVHIGASGLCSMCGPSQCQISASVEVHSTRGQIQMTTQHISRGCCQIAMPGAPHQVPPPPPPPPVDKRHQEENCLIDGNALSCPKQQGVMWLYHPYCVRTSPFQFMIEMGIGHSTSAVLGPIKDKT